MFDDAHISGPITVRSLGTTVTYHPEQLFAILRARYTPDLVESDLNLREINRRAVRKVYAARGHMIDTKTAGGIVDLVYTGQHVSAMVLQAYKRKT